MATKLKNNKQEQLHVLENTKSGAGFALRAIICQELIVINSSVIEINLSKKIRDFKQIDTFLDYINQNNLSIFLPSDCFITVFHSLLQSWRWADFKLLAKLIRDKQIAFSSNEKWTKDLFDKFVSNIQRDDDDLDRDQIVRLYSDLNDVVLVDGMFDQDKEKDLIEDIRFISFELKKIAESTLDKIFSIQQS
jgi:hypothetical protein